MRHGPVYRSLPVVATARLCIVRQRALQVTVYPRVSRCPEVVMLQARRSHMAATSAQEEQEMLDLALALSLSEAAPGQSQQPAPARSSSQPSIPRSARPSGTPHSVPSAGQGSTPSMLYPQHPRAPTYQPASAPPGPKAQAPRPSPPAATPPTASRAEGASMPAGSSKRCMHPDESCCPGCGKGLGWGSTITALNRKWHANCLVCGLCDSRLMDGGNTRFSIGGDDGWPYHMDCYKLKYHPTCHVCQKFVTPKADGRVEYKVSSFWNEKFCTSHATDGTPTCNSCSRLQSGGTEFATLSDGRHLCLACISAKVVTDTRDAQPLFDEILSFYSGMGLPLPERPPFMLVDGHTLNQYSEREGKDNHGGPVFHVRGLTLASVWESIPSIISLHRGSLSDALGVGSMTTSSSRASGVRCKVTAILVLYGLPRLLTGCIIAHETMHAWLRMKNVAGLDTKVEEGLCQLMAAVWLDREANSVTDPVEQRLASFFSYQIREDTSVIYGDGFREAFEAFQQRGLTAVINDVLRRGRIN